MFSSLGRVFYIIGSINRCDYQKFIQIPQGMHNCVVQYVLEDADVVVDVKVESLS